jgi:hypothetical protein
VLRGCAGCARLLTHDGLSFKKNPESLHVTVLHVHITAVTAACGLPRRRLSPRTKSSSSPVA